MKPLQHRITDDNPIFKEVLVEHEGWWLSDVMFDLTFEGVPLLEICYNLKEQGFT